MEACLIIFVFIVCCAWMIYMTTEDFLDKKNSTVDLKVRKVESYKSASKVDDLVIFQDRDSLELELKYNHNKYAKQDVLSTKRLIGYVKKSDLLEFLSKIEK